MAGFTNTFTNNTNNVRKSLGLPLMLLVNMRSYFTAFRLSSFCLAEEGKETLHLLLLLLLLLLRCCCQPTQMAAAIEAAVLTLQYAVKFRQRGEGEERR